MAFDPVFLVKLRNRLFFQAVATLSRNLDAFVPQSLELLADSWRQTFHVFFVAGPKVLFILRCYFFRPQLLKDGDAFSGLRPPVIEVDPKHFSLLAVPARADTEVDPPTAKIIKARDFVGEDQWMMLRH